MSNGGDMELSEALQAAKDHAEGKETKGRTTRVNISLDEFMNLLEHARADERERCVQSIESLDRSDEEVLGKHTKSFNKGVNVGLELAVKAIKAEGD